ncbi:MAG: deoxyribonucleotide triphosphate pyrophosphatase [Sphingobacteriales bacterium BACL12 MAG-120813-bin55]|jgi:XTP/dITP diphosphohydrolase|nr:MAG: deoxyribonucleotide triphosphate pyrophosphatase [Sphingobacteriales bacterium BACL12 MAG-120813-bin55]
MIELVFATNNKNKQKEIQAVLPPQLKVLSLKDIGCLEELPETHATIEENSMEKAVYVREKYGYPCFAEDTGLEVAALNGAPGVYSARYAGTGVAADNIAHLLFELNGITDRRARFKTVFTLVTDTALEQFTGIINGTITQQPTGEGGFGYDPVFLPTGYEITFAEMEPSVKQVISHRALAFQKLVTFLETTYKL